MKIALQTHSPFLLIFLDKTTAPCWSMLKPISSDVYPAKKGVMAPWPPTSILNGSAHEDLFTENIKLYFRKYCF